MSDSSVALQKPRRIGEIVNICYLTAICLRLYIRNAYVRVLSFLVFHVTH